MPTKDPTGNQSGLGQLPAPHIEYKEFGGGGGTAAAPAATPGAGKPTTEQINVSTGPHGRSFSMDTEDIVAIGALILCIGGLLAAMSGL